MKLILKLPALSFVLLVLFAIASQAQNTGKDKVKPVFSDVNKRIEPIKFEVLDTTQQAPPEFFQKEQYLLGYRPKAADYLRDLMSRNENARYLGPQKPQLDKDIQERRYFAGQEVNNAPLRSDASLGTFRTNGKSVSIQVRDFSLVDGDRIKVYVNQQVVNSNILLNSTSYLIDVDLQKGYNRIDIEALNQGYSGPNTAELRVYDDQGHLISSQEWNIGTGERATLGIIKND